jgi:N-methylhydantoinase B
VTPGHDSLDLVLFANRLERIVRKMTNTLFRTARSGVINTARDFSCAIVSADDQMLAIADSLPIMMLSGPGLITRYLKSVEPSPRAGDAFLHNSPYHGGSHAADHCVLAPVVDESHRHRFTVIVKAHVADCGNSIPSSLSPLARDVYEEGALIFPCVRVQADYRDCDDILRMCEMRLRTPDVWRGDLLAMLGAVRVGERELLALGRQTGWQEVDKQVERWLTFGDRRMAAAIGALPRGNASATTMHDAFPPLEEALRIRAEVRVDPEEAIIEVDLRDNPDRLPNGMNLTEATARACALTGVLNALPVPVPVNDGALSRVRVLLRENCAVGIPTHPTSCSLATTHPAIRTINVVQRALAQLADGIGMAESGSAIPAGGAAISGIDPRSGNRPYVGLLFFGLSGGAAGPFADGWPGADSNTAGAMHCDSVEIDELHYPFRVWVNQLVPDTEGPGRRRGSPSRRVEWSPTATTLTAHWMSDGDTNAALGARGGGAGGVASHYVARASGQVEQLPAVGGIELTHQDRLISISAAGGGYGPPHEREAERVRHDVLEGWITPGRAKTVYGVVLDNAGNVDAAQTHALRSRLAKEFGPDLETTAINPTPAGAIFVPGFEPPPPTNDFPQDERI